MGNPLLLIRNGGRGHTPVPEDALLKPGDLLQVHDGQGGMVDAECLAVVPARACIEYAIADQSEQPRPLIISDNPHRQTLYVLQIAGQQQLVAQAQMIQGLTRAEEAGLNSRES